MLTNKLSPFWTQVVLQILITILYVVIGQRLYTIIPCTLDNPPWHVIKCHQTTKERPAVLGNPNRILPTPGVTCQYDHAPRLFIENMPTRHWLERASGVFSCIWLIWLCSFRAPSGDIGQRDDGKGHQWFHYQPTIDIITTRVICMVSWLPQNET